MFWNFAHVLSSQIILGILQAIDLYLIVLSTVSIQVRAS